MLEIHEPCSILHQWGQLCILDRKVYVVVAIMEVVALPRAIHVKAKQEEAHCGSDVRAMVRDNMQVRPHTSSITYACVYIYTYMYGG